MIKKSTMWMYCAGALAAGIVAGAVAAAYLGYPKLGKLENVA